MSGDSTACKLLCASASAYFVQLDGKFVADSSSSKYKEYLNVGFIDTPLAFTNSEAESEFKINAAILGETETGYILAFRGTLPPSKPITLPVIKDWWQDICKIGEVHDDNLPGKVHEGFHTAFISIWPDIKTQLDIIYKTNGSTKPLSITGHSKGGPMASYAAYYAQNLGYPLSNVTTFASPYAGNSDWAKGYEAKVKQDSYENNLDIVPCLPPTSAFLGKMIPEIDALINLFEHVGFKEELEKFEHFINESLKLDYTPVGQLYFIKGDHSITTPEQDPLLKEKRIAAFIFLIGKDIWIDKKKGILEALQTIGDAHAIACGGGYEMGVCNIC